MARKYIFFVILLVVIAFFTQVSWVKPIVRSIFIFPAKVIKITADGTNNFFSFLYHAKTADEENLLLRKENAELKAQNALYRAKISQIEKLQSYGVSYRTLLCSVIARDPGNWFKTLVIDKGENDGVKDNMTVFLPQGVIGRTIQTQKTSSGVLLAIDKASNISVLVNQSREFGIAEGAGEKISMKFFTRDIKAKEGDEVLTSGLGGTFPKGLMLGRIKEIKKNGIVAQAVIEPSVDFNKIEEVFVLTK